MSEGAVRAFTSVLSLWVFGYTLGATMARLIHGWERWVLWQRAALLVAASLELLAMLLLWSTT